MAFTLIAHLTQGSTDTNGFTSSSINTTGADFLWVNVTDNSSGVITDSNGNTWQVDGPKHIGGFGAAYSSQFYVKNALGGVGHTFSISGTGNSPSIEVVAWSGSDTTSPLDQQNSASSNFGTSAQPGSITPGVNGELILTGISYEDTANALSIDSSFTISDQILQSNSAHVGGGAAYFVQSTAGAINPTWSESAGNIISITIASFKAASGAAVVFIPYTWVPKLGPILAQ